MGFVIRIALYAVAGLLLLGALRFFMLALTARALAGKQAYGVARQAKRLEMMQASFWGVGLVIVAGVFAAIASLSMWATAEVDEPTAEPTAIVEMVATEEAERIEGAATAEPTAEPTATPTAEPTATPTLPSPLAGETTTPEEPESPASPPAEEPSSAEPTATPAAPSGPVAYVDSPIVGLYLRTGPGGEIIERLEDRTVVQLSDERQTVDGLEWVRVTAPSGNVGWVAVSFLQPGQPPPLPEE